MAKVYEFLANGFETIEALIPLDILRRGGLDVQTVSIHDTLGVVSAQGVKVEADLLLADADLANADLLMLPGGMPGAKNLMECAPLREALLAHHAAGKTLAANCAAPMVLGSLGILKGKKATCFPGFEPYLDGAILTGDVIAMDGNIVTGEGPAAAVPWGYTLLSLFVGFEKMKEVQRDMRYLHLMGVEA